MFGAIVKSIDVVLIWKEFGAIQQDVRTVTCQIVCVYPLRKSKGIDFVGTRYLLLFLRWIFGAVVLAEVSGAQKDHVTVHKSVRSSFQASSDLGAVRSSHR